MKALLIAIAVGSLMLSALVAKAEDKDCLYVYNVAEDIMHQRQYGKSLPEMLTAVAGNAGRTALVKEAFSNYQVMNLTENKDASIKKFAEWSFNQCDKNK